MSQVVGLHEIEALLQRFGRVNRKAAKLAINDTARKLRVRGSREIRGQVNLKAAYVNKNLKVSQKASATSLRAVISAKRRPVLLTRYGAKQLTRKAKHPESSKGDPLRGIPPGRKAAGVSVRVKKGGPRKKMRGAFFIPLIGGAMGVAVRTGPGKEGLQGRARAIR